MANVKKGNLTSPLEWAKHLRSYGKRLFWSSERKAQDREITKQTESTLRSRGINRKATVNEAGDTVWPDSESPNGY